MIQHTFKMVISIVLKVCWIINAMLWNFIEHSSDEVIQKSIRNCN